MHNAAVIGSISPRMQAEYCTLSCFLGKPRYSHKWYQTTSRFNDMKIGKINFAKDWVGSWYESGKRDGTWYRMRSTFWSEYKRGSSFNKKTREYMRYSLPISKHLRFSIIHSKHSASYDA